MNYSINKHMVRHHMNPFNQNWKVWKTPHHIFPQITRPLLFPARNCTYLYSNRKPNHLRRRTLYVRSLWWKSTMSFCKQPPFGKVGTWVWYKRTLLLTACCWYIIAMVLFIFLLTVNRSRAINWTVLGSSQKTFAICRC